ncbi:MAG: methyltransferase domain-containing protein [Sphingomonadales bacterium]|nr:methyltransferase domain-containing protein [Sphingomonadales bacterium]
MDRPPDRYETMRRIARRLPGGMPVARWLRHHLHPDLREMRRLRRDHPRELFQPYPDTCEDRYPRLFDALASRLDENPSPRILSFGCSSGAEARALRQRISDARIVGLDLNRRAINAARRADRSPLSEYRCAAAPRHDERFDAILALAVFRHGDLEALRPDYCTAILPFARFAQGLESLDRCLAPGGWLAIWHAHFCLADTTMAGRYVREAVHMDGTTQDLLYGSDDRRLDGVVENTALFRKL